ncbi:Naphthalene 1,2-dioxygenase subunit alpha [Mycolicibacterium chubuense]|uniref:Naphthalene 1,2-dioxygenase subunit alpha n=1 Tax=Mycolicibacterium chubuense TaxID=1800 RepID=A0A0J6VSX1_MYCCU|nr:Naphthalene 1,2-dioxygenase subunit alpha [Mycolicibacterium chubuense]
MTDVDAAEELSEPMTIGVEAYTSEEYARAERDRLWRKVWLQVGRVEELPEVGSYLTYDILDDSIIVVRTGPGASCSSFSAHHNVCMHRGRRLIDTPECAKNAVGRARKSFVCGFHGWTYGLDGACTHIREQDDWQGKLTARNTHLAPVRVDTWGGWLFVSMDPDCEPLADYLFPAAKILDPFGLENMRYKWRRWLAFDCNWKVALEAFNETYHVFTTHPEFNRFGEFKGWAKAQGRHSNIGYDAPKGMDETKSKIRLAAERDSAQTRLTRPPHRRWWMPPNDWSRSCPRAHPPTRSWSTGSPPPAATTRPAASSGRRFRPTSSARAARRGSCFRTSRSARV